MATFGARTESHVKCGKWHIFVPDAFVLKKIIN